MFSSDEKTARQRYRQLVESLPGGRQESPLEKVYCVHLWGQSLKRDFSKSELQQWRSTGLTPPSTGRLKPFLTASDRLP
jgi:hypothetical protein